MRFEILNVDHGFAAYAIASDGSVLLFDCGHSSTCRPSEYLSARGSRTIRRLFISNYDEDHISDLPNVRQRLSVEILTRNASLTSTQLRGLKTHPISEAMTSLLEMIDRYTGDVTSRKLPRQRDSSKVEVSVFRFMYSAVHPPFGPNLELKQPLNIH